MDKCFMSMPASPGSVKVTDEFWQRAIQLVREEVIPYQWETLNDRVEGAAPSFCMHNFRAAARLMDRKRAQGDAFCAPKYVNKGFEVLPEDPDHPDEDSVYGFVFQDSDFFKWIEAVGWALAQRRDEALEAIADDAIDVICSAQTEDGYLNTYYIVNGLDGALTNLRDHHELYCFGHLTEAAIAYYHGTGKNKLLRAACRYADYFDARFGPEEGKLKGYPGHEITEMALIRLYEVTGEERYLRLGRFFIDQRGQEPNYFIEEEKIRAAREGKKISKITTNPAYHQAHQPVREQTEAVGHAVRAVYLYSGMADAARVTGDESLYAACLRLWEGIVYRKLYVTGGIGGTHIGEAFFYAYDLPEDSAYSETCAAIGLAFFARRMLQISPESRFADVMEAALYNTVLAGMALDGKSFFYVNPLSVVPKACRQDERLTHVKPVRQKWFGCACCPPNIARIVSSVAQYAYTENDGTLYTHLYMQGSVAKRFEEGEITMDVAANMPWDGRVRIRIHAEKPVNGVLAFRIPGWTQAPAYESHGKQQRIFGGYVYFQGVWQEGDTVELNFPMPVRMLTADPRVRESFGKVAFARGPVTYCAEEADNAENLHLLRVDEARIGEGCSGVFLSENAELGHRMVVLDVPGKRTIVKQQRTLYAHAQPPEEECVTIRMIPYYTWANRGEGEMSVWLRR